MDRRSWLWRRKSSEKSPSGETESLGSVSSHSGRFSDDQVNAQKWEWTRCSVVGQTPSNHITQSPSKTPPDDDELNVGVKTLSEKLSEALLDIQTKEDLVKQHAKVAEEAVSGWERAENEVSVVKKQLETLTQKNLFLEERVSHLDGALKECLRQLRQAREEREEKLHDAMQKENQLRLQLENASADADDARLKLEGAEKEISTLKLKLLLKDEELVLTSRERDLSTRAAETASKQHLDSIRKVAKLEAECRGLKATSRKAVVANDCHSITASSVCVDSLTDSQSDSGERMLVLENESFKTGGQDSVVSEHCNPDSWALAMVTKQHKTETRSIIVPLVEIDLMDDFLEMERLAALPDSGNDPTISGESSMKDELETMIKRTVELEENLRTMEMEKLNLEISLNDCRIQLKTSEHLLKQAEWKLVDLSSQLSLVNEAKKAAEQEAELAELKLKDSMKLLEEAEANLMQVQNQLTNVSGSKCMIELELENAIAQKTESESKLKVMELDLQNLRSDIRVLEKEVNAERNHSLEAQAKCETLESEIARMKLESQFQQSAVIEKLRINQDKELVVAAGKFAECQKTIASLGRQLKSLASLDDFLGDSDEPIAVI